MDTSDPWIYFNDDGVCYHCLHFDAKMRDWNDIYKLQSFLSNRIKKAKKFGKGNEYDCVIGLSGGIDSSYLGYLVKRKFGLRPLAVHLDNGWNSKLAVKNIEHIIRKLEIDLHTHVINWEEFKDIQIAYFKASVIDIEAITDHAILGCLFHTAAENNIKYLFLGTNDATERILPPAWIFNKYDAKNILSIHSRFGKHPIRTYPLLESAKKHEYISKKGIKLFSPLNFVRYVKSEARKVLIDELGWVDYEGKHYESIFTRFYQGYILPRKFNVDKRRAHFSTLINSEQMTRDQALEELKLPPYTVEMQKQDYDYVLKKLGFTNAEFEDFMLLPGRSHFDYSTDLHSKLVYKVYPRFFRWYPFLRPIYKQIRKVIRFA
jgi:N-acetyl sugar amidotransferase